MDTTIGHDVAKAAGLLKAGKLVAVPTETVYGLAGNALDTDAVVKIFEAKMRPAFDPLIVHIATIESLENLVAEVPDAALKLARIFWPGPLTLLLPKQAVIPDIVTSGLDTVGIRVPAHPLTAQLLKLLDFPLAAPSANLFGQVSPTSALHVKDQLNGRIPYILDGGNCLVGLESTIIGFPEGALPTIYRLGGVEVEEIEDTIGKVLVGPHSSSNPVAPGMLKSHYAPGKPLFIQNEEDKDFSKDASYLRFYEYLPDIPKDRQLILSEKQDLREAARNLFSYLRKLDDTPTTSIIAEGLPEKGLGKAINDRLRRAAAED